MAVDSLILDFIDVTVEGQGTGSVTFDANFGPASIGASTAVSQWFADQSQGDNPASVVAGIDSFMTVDASGAPTTHSNRDPVGFSQFPSTSAVIFADNAIRVTFSLAAVCNSGSEVSAQSIGTVYFLS